MEPVPIHRLLTRRMFVSDGTQNMRSKHIASVKGRNSLTNSLSSFSGLENVRSYARTGTRRHLQNRHRPINWFGAINTPLTIDLLRQSLAEELDGSGPGVVGCFLVVGQALVVKECMVDAWVGDKYMLLSKQG